MVKSITQDYQNDKDFSVKVGYFFKKYRVGSALKEANAYKKKGIPVLDVFRYLFLLVFSNRSMYMDMLSGRNPLAFAKDTVYRFMNQTGINWMRFTTVLASRMINLSIAPLTSEERENVLIIDDSVFSRNRSKKVELLTKIWDHANRVYLWGFRMLTLSWSDGNTLIPVNSVLMTSEDGKKRLNENGDIDKRSVGYRQRLLSKTKATDAMIELIKAAKKADIPAKYVLFDSWFSSPKTLHAIKDLELDVIAMVKRSPKMQFGYNGRKQPLTEIYKHSRKRRGRSRYLLSVIVDVEKDGRSIPAKVVFVRNKSNRKEYLCIISTDTDISEDEIIRLYSKRWQIEVFFKVCKSYLKLARECRMLSYDAITAHVAVVFTRYMMLSVENRISNDQRTLGELFIYFTDEMADVTWLQAFSTLMQVFRQILVDEVEVSEEKLSELMDTFIGALPAEIRLRLKAA